MRKINIAVIPGDGIGTEVMPEGLRVLEGLCLTRDMGGSASTQDLGKAIAALLE